MKFGKRDKSIVDAIFLLVLFAVFLICALFIVLFGAKIYKNTVQSANDSFVERTCYTYITEKIRQNDDSTGISILDDGDNSIIVLTKTVNDSDYTTFLYCDEGYLKEFMTSKGNDLVKSAGTKIVGLDSLKAEICNGRLCRFSLKSGDLSESFYVSTTSLGGGSNE